MGDPKATATPAAELAVTISRMRSDRGVSPPKTDFDGRTLTAIEAVEDAADDVADAAGHVDRGPFLAH
jgi:hypothetical protein